ncbi:MAG: hypothetical protein HON18_13640 [Rhodospirillaceae bacterium]|nr:hypothetical protein [Rhodospirillaceae bacterium]MBT6243394.1 hypothetical protein [Rhodospirillaceae bacterium]
MPRDTDINNPYLKMVPFGIVDCRNFGYAYDCLRTVFHDKIPLLNLGMDTAENNFPDVSFDRCLAQNPSNRVFSPLKWTAFNQGYFFHAKYLSNSSPIEAQHTNSPPPSTAPEHFKTEQRSSEVKGQDFGKSFSSLAELIFDAPTFETRVGIKVLELAVNNSNDIYKVIVQTLGRPVELLEIFYLGYWLARQAAADGFGAEQARIEFEKVQEQSLWLLLGAVKVRHPNFVLDSKAAQDEMNGFVKSSDERNQLYLDCLKIDVKNNQNSFTQVAASFLVNSGNEFISVDEKVILASLLTPALAKMMQDNMAVLRSLNAESRPVKKRPRSEETKTQWTTGPESRRQQQKTKVENSSTAKRGTASKKKSKKKTGSKPKPSSTSSAPRPNTGFANKWFLFIFWGVLSLFFMIGFCSVTSNDQTQLEPHQPDYKASQEPSSPQTTTSLPSHSRTTSPKQKSDAITRGQCLANCYNSDEPNKCREKCSN